MNLQDNYFAEQIESDVTLFAKNKTRKRILIFPPVNNYKRFIIHQSVQDNFFNLSTFSIGQGTSRRTVVCYKEDLISETSKLNGRPCSQINSANQVPNSSLSMVVKDDSSPSPASPENTKQRQVKSVPAIEIYRPPAARKVSHSTSPAVKTPETNISKKQRRPDRAVYVPRGRRNLEEDGTGSTVSPSHSKKSQKSCEIKTAFDLKTERLESSPDELYSESTDNSSTMEVCTNTGTECLPAVNNDTSIEPINHENINIDLDKKDTNGHYKPNNQSNLECVGRLDSSNVNEVVELSKTVVVNGEKEEVRDKDSTNVKQKQINKVKHHKSDVLIISSVGDSLVDEQTVESDPVPVVQNKSSDKKVKKVARNKSKPASPPSPPVKFNRDECDWDSLFDDNGECLDPTLIEELTAAVGEVSIEHPKSDYKPFTRTVEVSSGELAHVIEIYNFPPDFKTSDLATVFSPFKNGGFELKWVDDTHCLGVFSSPLVAAEVLASDHPFVKTRPLSEATALSKTKAKKSAEFLQPYRSRPETCAALARRLVTGALGVKLATFRQEREHEKVVLREAKERRRLANKQREDAWEGIITTDK